MQHVAKTTEHKITSKNQLVAEMGETCSAANGQVSIDQTQKRAFNEENLDEEKAMDEKIKKKMKEWKDNVRNIEKIQEDFAKSTNNLPGVIKTLGTAAAKNLSYAFGPAFSFVQKAAEKMAKGDFLDLISFIGDRIAESSKGQKDVNDSLQTMSFEDEQMTQEQEELYKETMLYTNTLPIKTAVDMLIKILDKHGSFQDMQGSASNVWKRYAKLNASMRKLKITGNDEEIQTIANGVLTICETIVSESRQFNTSQEPFNRAMKELNQYQMSLEQRLKEMKASMNRRSSEIKRKEDRRDLSTPFEKRFFTGKELHYLWKKCDKKTQDISWYFEAQKETARQLSQLKLNIEELQKTLDATSKASVHLSNVSTLNTIYWIR